MKTYLVMSANKSEFIEACKEFRVKCNDVHYYVISSPVYGFKSKKKAIEECRKMNNFKAENEIDFLLTYDKTYYIKEISIY